MPLKTRQQRIDQAVQKHNNRYQYHLWTDDMFVSSGILLPIVCTTHGPFYLTADDHCRKGRMCKQCVSVDQSNRLKKLHKTKTTSLKPRWTTEKFITKAKEVHGDKYDYSKVVYVKSVSPVTIICKEHGEFQQKPNAHINIRHGCPKCGDVSSSVNRTRTTEQVIEQSKAVHGDLYDYTHTTNVPGSPITIKCRIHGSFTQQVSAHINGHGCPKCGTTRGANFIRKSLIEFVDQSREVHGKTYDYSQVEYINHTTPVTIGCAKHGEFQQKPSGHLSGNGCPKCSHQVSKGEQQIVDFLKEYDVNIEQSNRTLIAPYELDILIPDHNLAIEYCGLYWHSEQQGKNRHYHKNKMERCSQLGIQLLTIFEDEWIDRQDQVKRKLLHLINKTNQETIYARKCTNISVSTKTKQQFFEDNHIQGSGPGSINIGLVYDNELVACMSFIKQKDQHYLNRYATSRIIPGGFSKLLKYFKLNYEWTKLISFADLRWSDGNLYQTTGWELDGTIPPDYYYSPDGNQRIHKFNYRRKQLPRLLRHFDPKLSEWENCKANGVLKIWDCGKQRWVLYNN